MRILFMDKFCPGYFSAFFAWLSKKPDYELVFISEYLRKDYDLGNVKYIQVRIPRSNNKAKSAEDAFTLSLRRAGVFSTAMEKLKNSGFTPEYIYVNAMENYAMRAREIFPSAKIVGVFDWVFQNSDLEVFKKYSLDNRFTADSMRVRNMLQFEAFNNCDIAITNTNWQRDTFPEYLRDKINILPQAIDTDFFSPCESRVQTNYTSQETDFVTYISRTISIRNGFETFYRSLPILFEKNKNAVALIVGHVDAEGDVAKLISSVKLDTKRVHFMKFCSYEEYKAILRASDAHVFLSPPYNLSNGILEAMSTSCTVFGSKTAPAMEFIKENDTGMLVDFFDYEELGSKVATVLNNKPDFMQLRNNAREKILKEHNYGEVMKRHDEMSKNLTK